MAFCLKRSPRPSTVSNPDRPRGTPSAKFPSHVIRRGCNAGRGCPSPDCHSRITGLPSGFNRKLLVWGGSARGRIDTLAALRFQNLRGNYVGSPRHAGIVSGGVSATDRGVFSLLAPKSSNCFEGDRLGALSICSLSVRKHNLLHPMMSG